MRDPADEIQEMQRALQAIAAERYPEALRDVQMSRVSGPHLLEPVLPQNRPVLGWILPGEVHALKRGEAIVIAPVNGPGALVLAVGSVQVFGPAFILEALPKEVAELKDIHASDLAVLCFGLLGLPAAWIHGSIGTIFFGLGMAAVLVLALAVFRPHRIIKHSILMFRAQKP